MLTFPRTLFLTFLNPADKLDRATVTSPFGLVVIMLKPNC